MSQNLPGGNDPILRQWHLLMTGYGYNFYSTLNQARSDDQLVRQKASSSLTAAASRLVELEGEYQKRFVPPSSREQPFPPADAVAGLREIRELRQAVSNLDSQVRGMSVPNQDRIFQRFRDEEATLRQLIQFDYGLITASETLFQNLHDTSVERLREADTRDAISQQIHRLNDTVRARERMLQAPF